MDLLEFCAKNIGLPIEGGWHEFMRHHHLSWDHENGLKQFVGEINLLFHRNGVAYKLSANGKVQRLISETLEGTFWSFLPFSSDNETDRLIYTAKEFFLSPKLEDRRDALDKWFDGFERLKTLEVGKNKKRTGESNIGKGRLSTT